VILFELSERIV